MTKREPHAPGDFMEKARRNLSSARALLDLDDPDSAANRAYYAMFQAATAALALRGEACATHTGVIARFSVLFVLNGTFPKDMGRAFNLAERRGLRRTTAVPDCPCTLPKRSSRTRNASSMRWPTC